MRRKDFIWIGVLAVAAGLYVHYCTNWFAKKTIGITPSLRPLRHAGSTVYPVFFTLDNDYRLTSIKVIPLENNQFNPQTPPVWHLISKSNSAPVRMISYGHPVRGMESELAHVHAEQLNPGAVYRLILTAGDVTGTVDFKTAAVQVGN